MDSKMRIKILFCFSLLTIYINTIWSKLELDIAKPKWSLAVEIAIEISAVRDTPIVLISTFPLGTLQFYQCGPFE